ncbi:MAG TPA: hypothetical protein VGK56_18840 [Anaerolineales bacterium]
MLSLFTAIHTFMVGNKDIRGWIVAMTAQVMWSVWVVASATWGLLPLNIILWGLYIRNYRRWRNHEDDHSKLQAALARIEDLELSLDIKSRTINVLKDQASVLKSRLHRQVQEESRLQAKAQRYDPFVAGVRQQAPVEAPNPTVFFDNPSYPDWERRRESPPAFEAGGAINAFAGGGAEGTWEPDYRAPEPPAPNPAVDSAETCSRNDYSSSSSYSDSSSSGSDSSSSSGGSSGTD